VKFHKHGSIGEHIDPVIWTTTICFEVVGGQSRSFVVGPWSLSS